MELRPQRFAQDHIDGPSDRLLEVNLNASLFHQTERRVAVDLDENVDVTYSGRIAAGNRTEETDARRLVLRIGPAAMVGSSDPMVTTAQGSSPG